MKNKQKKKKVIQMTIIIFLILALVASGLLPFLLW